MRALPSNNVPLDHWSYAALDKLSGFGLLQSNVYGTRPFTRLEVARLVNEALTTKEQKSIKLPPLIEHFLERFQREFREELAVFGRGKENAAAALVLTPIEEARARYIYSDGEPRDILNFRPPGVRQYPRSGGGIAATEGTPLVYNNEGVLYGPGSNFSLQFASSFKFLDMFSGYIEPILVVHSGGSDGRSLDALSQNSLHGSLGSFNQTEADVLKGYLKVSPWNVEVEVGRDSMWWGQGSHGSLILTNNAAPLDMVKLSNPTASLLPWIFSYLGPFKYTVFLARLEAEREFPHTELGGMRIDFKPLPDLEIGMSRVFMFGGDGAPSSSGFVEFLKIASFAELGGGQNDATNQIAAFDFRYRMPFLWNAEVYLEWGGEDSGFKPDMKEFLLQDLGYLVGLYLPRITSSGRTDLRFEYADNVNTNRLGLWYGHSRYVSGYTHQGLILGHHMSSDARDMFTRARHYLRNDLVVGLDFDFMERGDTLNPIVSERTYQVGLDVTYDINAALTLMTRYSYGQVENFDLNVGEDRQNNLLIVEMKYTF